MTDYELKVPGKLLSSLLGKKDGLAGLVEAVLNQVLEAQAAEQVGAGHYERTDVTPSYLRNRMQSTRGDYGLVDFVTHRGQEDRRGNVLRAAAQAMRLDVRLGVGNGDSHGVAVRYGDPLALRSQLPRRGCDPRRSYLGPGIRVYRRSPVALGSQ